MPRIMIDHGNLFRLKPRWIHAPRSDSNPIGQCFSAPDIPVCISFGGADLFCNCID
jgi:hypothetical protein